MISWLQDENIEISSTQNDEKSVVAEQLIRIFKNWKLVEKKFYVKWEGYDNWFNSWVYSSDFIDMTIWDICKHFPKHHSLFGRNIKIELGLSNYATKHDVRKAKGVDTT